MIVLSLYYPHEIGRTYTEKDWGFSVTDMYGNAHNKYTYKVIAEATEADWRKCILEHNPHATMAPPIGDKFYWVQMD